MAEYSKLITTNIGKALIAKMLAGTTDIDFTRIVSSSTTYEVEELESLTELTNIQQSSMISHKEITNQTAVQVETLFTNLEVTAGYYMRTLGLYADDPDEGEILFAVTAEASGNCYMPAYNGVTVSSALITLITTVGNAESVSLEVDLAGAATVRDIQSVSDALKLHVGDDGKHVKPTERAAWNATYEQSAAYTDKEIARLIYGAPETLDTLKEVADAIKANDTVVTALNDAIGSKTNNTEFDAHSANNIIHITAAERINWSGKPPTNHATTALTYGGGTAENYGHVKLSDVYNSNIGAAGNSIAASQKALFNMYQEMRSLMSEWTKCLIYKGNWPDFGTGYAAYIPNVAVGTTYMIKFSDGAVCKATVKYAATFDNVTWITNKTKSCSIAEFKTDSGGLGFVGKGTGGGYSCYVNDSAIVGMSTINASLTVYYYQV